VLFPSEHPQVTRIFYNGATAERLFRRHVLPGLDRADSWQYLRLPSTSPANAGASRADKLAAWRAIAR
jgi:G:T/U-mismatch repair DNA glycosylase